MENQPPKPELTHDDYVAGATIFAAALSRILKTGEGILVQPEGTIANHFSPNNDLLLIANDGVQITVNPLCNFIEDISDFEDGMIVEITNEEPTEEKSEE